MEENKVLDGEMISFKNIKEANDSIITTNIKGRDYAEVNQRIKAFRMLYPQGFIHTGITSNEDGVCVMRAEVGYFENGAKVILGTGTAYEKENSTFINKTSFIENCETSAVGRALAMCGIGIDTSIASKEEVENAMANQNKAPTVTQLKAKIKTAKLTDEEIQKTLDYYKVKDLKDLDDKQKIELENHLLGRIKKLNESED